MSRKNVGTVGWVLWVVGRVLMEVTLEWQKKETRQKKFLLMLVLFMGLFAGESQAYVVASDGADTRIITFLPDDCEALGHGYKWDDALQNCTKSPDATLVWSGFRHAWQSTSHRLSHFGSYFDSIDFNQREGQAKGELSANIHSAFEVGDFSDKGDVVSRGRFIKSNKLNFLHGVVDDDCVVLEGVVGQEQEATCTIKIDLTNTPLAQTTAVTVLLDGFDLEIDNESGYNTRGFGIRVIPGKRVGNIFNFKVKASVHPAGAPDRHTDGDRFVYATRVYYTLVGVHDDAGAITNADEDGTNSYSQTAKVSARDTYAYPSASQRASVLEGEEGFEDGFVGIQGFSWHLEDDSSTNYDGRYIRDLEIALNNVDYDANTAEATFDTNMFFSNESFIPFGYTSDFVMWNALIQVNDDGFRDSGNKVWKGAVERGAYQYESEVSYEF